MAEAFNIGRFTGISFSDDTVQETAAQAIHVTVDDTPTHAGQLLISQPGNETAIWADPQVQGLYAEGSSISDPPAYSAPTTICPIYIGGKNPTGDLLGISVDADGYLEVSNAVLNDLTFTQYGSPAVEALNVYVVNEAGSSGNPAAGLTGSPVPTYADYIGFEDDSSNLIGVSATNPLPVVGSFAAPTGTQTVTVAGTSTVTIAGIAAGTVQVAGIVGTSTVTVAGNVAVASVAGTSTVEIAGIVGTPTVEVAGVLGTSTVTVAGTVIAACSGTQTVTVSGNVAVTGQLTAPTGTQTVEVAGIIGTSTVTVAGNVSVTGQLTAPTGTQTVTVAGNVAVSSVAGTSTVTVAGNVTVAGQLTAPTGTQTVQVAGISAGTIAVAGTSTVTVVGGAGNAAAGATGSPVPSDADYIGFLNGATLVGVSVTNPLPITGSLAAPTNTQTVTIAGNVTVTGQLTAPTGTPTVEVAGILGTSTVEVAGIIGTSTVTVAGSIAAAVTGTQTVTVAGGVIGAVPVATQVYQTPSTGTPWTTATEVNSTQTLFNGQNISPTIINVQLDTSNSTFTTGAISFQVTGDGINWITIPTQLVLDPTSYGPISLPYTLVTNTMRNFLLLVAGYQGIRIILTTAITGASSPTVTPYWNAVSLSHVVAPVGIYESGPTSLDSGQSSSLQLDSAANLKVNVVAGTVAVTGQLTAPTGTSTVEVAGIVGTSTVTVAGNVTVTGQTVQVAGISAGTVAVAGTSTVEVAGIVGTSTVAVTGQIAGPVAAGIAASSSVLTGQVYNSTAPALTTGQQVAEQCDAAGSIFVHPFRRSQLVMSTATVTGTTAVTLVANPGASTYADILSLMGGFQITSTATLVAQAIVGTLIISDGTISYSVPITSAYSPFNICLEAPIPATNASTTWSVALKAVLIGSPTVNLSCMVVKQVAS